MAHAPAATTAAQVPQWARSISGRTYVLPDNPVGLHALQLNFTTGTEALLHMQFVDAPPQEHPVGLDGVPRLSPDAKSGHRVALLGQWRPGAFLLDYNEVARIDDYRLLIAPTRAGLNVHLTERTGLVDLQLAAKPD